MKKKNRGLFNIFLKTFLRLLLLIIIIFISAGRITYWQGWVYSGFYAIEFIIVLMVCVKNPDFADLIKERVKPGPGTKWWDKVFMAFYLPLYGALVVMASLDAGSFGWTPPLSVPVYVIAYTFFILGHCITLWAMWTNRFFSSTVRIQTERGHMVVQEGSYRYVRHPGYVGAIVVLISTSLVLGSLLALIPASVIVVLLLIRTYREDITLQKELEGYADYVRKVRYRLIPGIW